MRIVIEIDGEKVTSTTVEGSGTAAGPPPEVLRAADARGAISAGRAPTRPDMPEATSGAAPQDAGGARTRPERAERPPAPARSAQRRTGSKSTRTRRSR
jgi:hypothetical protein